MQPVVHAFFDNATNTVSYIVQEPAGQTCAIIDSVLDYDQAAGRTDTASADAIIAFVKDHDLQVAWILESHVHADHLVCCAVFARGNSAGKSGSVTRSP